MATTPFSVADGLYIKDDFFSNEGVADTTAGELGWELVTIGNASTTAYLVTTNVGEGEFGVLRDTTAATADGDGEVYRLDEDNIVLGSKGGRFRARVRLADQIASNNFRIGLQDSVTATSPTVGIWIDCDGGVLSLQADSADHGDVSAAAAGVGTLTSGTTMVVTTWHDIEVRFDGENANGGPDSAQMYVDGELAAKLDGTIVIDNDEEMELSIVHWQDSGGALAVELDIDYIELFLAR
uniref:Uncharacterized protein n=1 Tax=viral metagenome TaxID=1070528 RepID=A0A6H1ZSS3_9ZZZZ